MIGISDRFLVRPVTVGNCRLYFSCFPKPTTLTLNLRVWQKPLKGKLKDLETRRKTNAQQEALLAAYQAFHYTSFPSTKIKEQQNGRLMIPPTLRRLSKLPLWKVIRNKQECRTELTGTALNSIHLRFFSSRSLESSCRSHKFSFFSYDQSRIYSRGSFTKIWKNHEAERRKANGSMTLLISNVFFCYLSEFFLNSSTVT